MKGGPGTALAKILPNLICLLTIDNMRLLRLLTSSCTNITNKHVIQ
jgi:hypothetical protein